MKRSIRSKYLLLALLLWGLCRTADAADPVRVGIIGIDNYQSLAFTQLWHKPPEDNPDLGGLKVVAAWQGGSPDIEETVVDVGRWTVATEIAKFYKTGKSPIDPAETIELFGFMEAAHESHRQGGVPVRIDEVIAQARRKLDNP